MSAQTIPLTIEQGATFEYRFEWHQDSTVTPGMPGEPIDLTNAVLRMQIRKSQQSPVLVEATSDAPTPFITHNGPGGTVSIKLPAVETNKLSVKEPKYDVEVVMPGGDVFRLIEGSITVKPNITQVTGEPVVR